MENKVLMLGGTSHAGKSTMAERLATELGRRALSTDQLARHPGRPWRDDGSALPPDVVAHFRTLSTVALVADVTSHYRNNVWPIAQAIVRSHLNNPFDPALVFEGSALLPDLAAANLAPGAAYVWLSVPADEMARRIRANSGYEHRDHNGKTLIDAFISRGAALETQAQTWLARHPDVLVLNGSDPQSLDRLLEICRP